MRFLCVLVLAVGMLAGVSGCGEDNPVRPPADLAPPTNLTAVTGEMEVSLSWVASPFEGEGNFAGYNIYADTVSIADSTSGAFLNSRLLNDTPTTSRTFTATMLADMSSLMQGQKYYFHVRTVRADERLSVASNEVDTAPRPEGTNETVPADSTLLMYDFDTGTATPSAYGWDRPTGDGMAYQTNEGNGPMIDFFMAEAGSPQSNTESVFISPATTNITMNWAAGNRNETLFLDLGAGDAAWETTVAPSISSMTSSAVVQADHTYAMYTHDGHWAKIRVLEFARDLNVPGGTKTLNRATFQFAFQLINEYGRFKPRPGGRP